MSSEAVQVSKCVDSVSATLVFAKREELCHSSDRPYNLHYQPRTGLPRSNIQYEVKEINIYNLRKSNLSFPQHGLAAVGIYSKMRYGDFACPEAVEGTYLPEVFNILKNLLRTDEVYIFEWVVRRRDESFPFPATKPYADRQPATASHIDYTADDIKKRIVELFGEKADALLQRHCQVVNVWKPLRGPLQDWPMAYCDPLTLDRENDLIIVDDVYTTHVSEVFNLHYSERHRWYYLKDQLESEVVVFSGYDSERADGTAVPHCSFDLDDGSTGPLRESIEVRAIAFF